MDPPCRSALHPERRPCATFRCRPRSSASRKKLRDPSSAFGTCYRGRLCGLLPRPTHAFPKLNANCVLGAAAGYWRHLGPLTDEPMRALPHSIKSGATFGRAKRMRIGVCSCENQELATTLPVDEAPRRYRTQPLAPGAPPTTGAGDTPLRRGRRSTPCPRSGPAASAALYRTREKVKCAQDLRTGVDSFGHWSKCGSRRAG